jgi:alkylhydroperoxidase family enzyme
VSALITLRAADFQATVKRHFDDRQIVELTVLIGSYNMNARVLRALELDLEPSVPPQSE